MINQQTQESIIIAILSEKDYLGKYSNSDKIMSFLLKIWPLRSMISEDSRFNNAYDDIYQHIVNNDDWDDDYLYFKRLQIINQPDDSIFRKFIETIIHPETRLNKNEINRYLSLINNLLINESERLVLVDYFEAIPVYKIRFKITGFELPSEIATNTIPFFKGEADTWPCFTLSYIGWDDFGRKTKFNLRYYTSSSDWGTNIGEVKILFRDSVITIDFLEGMFTVLPPEFCSLGQTKSYYTTLKKIFPTGYNSILLALRDIAIFPSIAEIFESHSGFKNSLIRNNEAERTFRTIRYELQEGDFTDYFKFTYAFQPNYAEFPSNIFFNFKYHGELENRIIALIGKNGTGKTTLLSSLIQIFARQNNTNNLDKMPLFGKYFTVSYSIFDKFPIPEPNAAFNYIYCGLRKNDNSFKSQYELHEDFIQSSEKIKTRDLTYQWYNILKKFLSEYHLYLLFPNSQQDLAFGMVTFDQKNFNEIKDHFSSGESILLFIITKIISEIRYDSLILYDEPETHLHPNAITSLMDSLFELVSTFKSFCVIATHSPLIIRELHSSQVKVLKRDGNYLELHILEKDPFGENLTVVTDEIFGNRDVNKHYRKIVKSLVDKGRSYETIIQLLQENDIPISLNTRLYLNTLIPNDHDESQAIS